ncbi:MAG: HEPN domain-containing protein [Candidatus Omnitrophota bacterium]
MQKVIQEWVEISEYDLRTAEAMLNAGRYLYVFFMCQQAVEKILKALYVQRNNELPPRTHNLLYLVEVLEIGIQDKNLALFSQLNQFYFETRYPGDRIQLAREVDRNKAREILKKTQGAWECLKQLLQ